MPGLRRDRQRCIEGPFHGSRQWARIIAALAGIDADVVGLIEIGNYPGDVPVANLVSGSNDVLGAGTYDYVATGAIGDDAIGQAFIFKPATVSLVGAHALLDDPAFTNPLAYADGVEDPPQLSRPALAQTFMDNSTGGIFTVVVNHLKSKGSACGPGDGDPVQCNCNVTRTLGAQAFLSWLATDPTGSGDADVLVIGDLNAYDKEDLVDTLVAGVYTDLILKYMGEGAYSYVFDGQVGYLDHGLADVDVAIAGDVTGATVWHINADEPDLIDYDMTFRQDALYAADPYRPSDHDPVIIGLSVCDEIAPTIDSITAKPDRLWPVDLKYRTVKPKVTVSDNFDPDPTVTLVSVTSNEADNGLGDGDMPVDIVIIEDFTFDLRAERMGADPNMERIYTITYQVTDACDNRTTASVEVIVPHDVRKCRELRELTLPEPRPQRGP